MSITDPTQLDEQPEHEHQAPEPGPVTTELAALVKYVNRDGREYAAIVTATPDSDPEVASRPGTVHLYVISPRSGGYCTHHVPEDPDGILPNTWHH